MISIFLNIQKPNQIIVSQEFSKAFSINFDQKKSPTKLFFVGDFYNF